MNATILLRNFFIFAEHPQSKTGGGTYKYDAINYIHHFQLSIGVVTGIYHLWPTKSAVIFKHPLNLSETAMYSCIAAAAYFLTTETVCKIIRWWTDQRSDGITRTTITAHFCQQSQGWVEAWLPVRSIPALLHGTLAVAAHVS